MDIPRIHINIKIIIDKPYTYFFVCLFKYRVSCYFVFCDKIIFNGIWCVNIWKITITTYCYTFLTCRFIVGANSGRINWGLANDGVFFVISVCLLYKIVIDSADCFFLELAYNLIFTWIPSITSYLSFLIYTYPSKLRMLW